MEISALNINAAGYLNKTNNGKQIGRLKEPPADTVEISSNPNFKGGVPKVGNKAVSLVGVVPRLAILYLFVEFLAKHKPAVDTGSQSTPTLLNSTENDWLNEYSTRTHDNQHDIRTFLNFTDYGIVKINELAKQDKNKAIQFANFIENKWATVDLTPNQIDYLAEKFNENPDIVSMFKDFAPRDKVYMLKSCEKEPEATKALYSYKNSLGYPFFRADHILMLVDTYKKYPDRVNDLIEESKRSKGCDYDAVDIIYKVYGNRLKDVKIKDYPGYSYMEEIKNSIK